MRDADTGYAKHGTEVDGQAGTARMIVTRGIHQQDLGPTVKAPHSRFQQRALPQGEKAWPVSRTRFPGCDGLADHVRSSARAVPASAGQQRSTTPWGDWHLRPEARALRKGAGPGDGGGPSPVTRRAGPGLTAGKGEETPTDRQTRAAALGESPQAGGVIGLRQLALYTHQRSFVTWPSHQAQVMYCPAPSTVGWVRSPLFRPGSASE